MAYSDDKYLTIKDAKLKNMSFINSEDTAFYNQTLINKTSVPRVPIQNEGHEAVDSDTNRVYKSAVIKVRFGHCF